ncbi:MAG: hypothetical protein IPM54_10150 [Polyangiaceae bacterium]|nr:hypothetical protein [Polyangiaceae bacterium]
MRLSLCVILAVLFQFVHAPSANAADYDRPVEAPQAGGFSPSLFIFVTIVPYDGQGPGGWQEAVATLKFIDMRHLLPETWTCTIKVGMPIRPRKYGVISPAVAASMSAAAATTASKAVMMRQPKWMAAAYCIQFATEVRVTLNTTWVDLGARVNRL